ncbi:Retrovirus-related Pol polyprotein from transposon TNT 1-94 [Vitis vinifera]|uniref:Retrovirus-related Pol polyprotein from transposon TNT 1-94 n=1 Tax=Vitis vinifera TaxID=29760 RepID=A0A438IG51_VITVI|nr:Retrovirus-related Pol polyprotein from transposon TNT 1-94 [Vitis vinifera]
MNQDLVRLDRFDGSNFTRWQDKVRFLLTALKIFYILDPTLAPLPEPKENDTPQVVAARKKREEDELICRGHILNALSDRLYDLYTNTYSAREIWEALENKYKAEEEGTKKFLISQYIDFKFFDEKPLLPQIHELQVIVNKLKVLKIELPEAFQVGAIVAKLPSSWKGYRKRILHKSEDYSLEEIQKHLRIEEELRSRDKMAEESNGGTNKANAVSKANHPRGKNNNDKRNSGNYMSPKKNQEQFKGKKGPCFVCGKLGHYARECRYRKDLKGVVVNAIDEEIIATLSDVCVVQGKVQGWWYDTCATVHVTYDKSLFKTFEDAKGDQEVQMGNEGRSKVLGKGTIEVVFTSGKKVTLINVLYVPDMNKNLVSGDLLGKPGIKGVFESGKLILSKSGNFVGKGLAHVGLSTIKRIVKCGLIACDTKKFEKSETFNAFKVYKAEVENQLEKNIKVLRSDRGGEYFSSEFNSFCEEYGIIHECTAPYTPQHNGIAERKNRTFLEMVNAMLLHAKLNFNLWGEVLLTACHILNRIPMKKNEISPYELWKGRKPNIGYFKVWGCLAYCKKTDPNKTKLGPRAIKCAFVGYASNSKAYRLLDLESNVIIESREVEFFENLLSDSNSQVPTSVGESLEETPSKVVEQPIVPRKSQRARKEKVLGLDEIDSQIISFYLVEGNREDIIRKIPIVLQIEEDPKTYKEVMASRDVAFWKEAINDEMDSIMSNQTWELIDLPPGSKPIRCKWVFRMKYHTDGMIQTFKARLVAKGFKQREGIDYFDTYAPVARTTSIRILFALASIHNLFVHQIDVKTAFLNGDLNEEVYMEQPEVCLYVDDMLILSDDMKGIIETKRFLSSTFKMKDLGEVDTILGIKVKRNSGGYALNQTHYIEKVVSKFCHLKIKDANTPFDSSIKLEKNDGRSVAQLEYASAIGSLMYAAQCTRADISFAVSKLSRFISNPSVEHWKAIGRVLGYLKNTKELSLQYSKFPIIIEGYSDASWISSVRDNLSTTGWVFTLGGGVVSWGSKKQTCISHSTMEAEFIALAATGKEVEWLKDLMMDIPFTANNVSTVSIHCDSQATLARAYSGVYNGKSRHISIRHEYVRQLIQNGVISISFVRSSGNLADPFTKPLARDLLRITSRGMGLKLLK